MRPECYSQKGEILLITGEFYPQILSCFKDW